MVYGFRRTCKELRHSVPPVHHYRATPMAQFPPLTPHQRVLNDYRGPGFLARRMIWLLALPPLPTKKLARRHTGGLRKRYYLLTGEGEGGGRRAESYDRKKAWSSINHSLLSYPSQWQQTVSELQSCYMACARDKNGKTDPYIMILMRANPFTRAHHFLWLE